MTSKAMSYELTTPKVGSSKAIKNKVTNEALNQFSTSRMLWHIIKRHKFGLVVTWAMLVTISYLFPPIWSVIGGMLQSI